MKRSIAGILGSVALVASLSAAPAAYAADTAITGIGASYVAKAFEACKTSVPGVSLTYTGTGSGNGRTGLTNYTHNFGAMDWPYSTETKPSFSWTYVPVVGGPIVVAYNVPGLNLKLDGKVTSAIFKGKITQWNDKAIAALNKGAKLPAKPITIAARTGSSGTTQNFAAYLKDQAPADNWNTNGVFATASGNSKITGTGSNALSVSTVKSTPFAITYADLADVLTGGVQLAAVKNGAGQFVKPSVASASKFLAVQEMSAKTGLVRYDYDANIKGAYNLSLISYVAAPTSKGTEAAKAVRTWLDGFLSTCSPAKSPTVGYVPLSGSALKTAKALAAKVG